MVLFFHFLSDIHNLTCKFYVTVEIMEGTGAGQMAELEKTFATKPDAHHVDPQAPRGERREHP